MIFKLNFSFHLFALRPFDGKRMIPIASHKISLCFIGKLFLLSVDAHNKVDKDVYKFRIDLELL